MHRYLTALPLTVVSPVPVWVERDVAIGVSAADGVAVDADVIDVELIHAGRLKIDGPGTDVFEVGHNLANSVVDPVAAQPSEMSTD